MSEMEFQRELRAKAQTISRFNKYRKYVCKALGISRRQYEAMQSLIIKNCGYWYDDETYCGPGDIGDMLVPDLIFSFAGYVHDAIYGLIELGILDPREWKSKGDLWFYTIMRKKSRTFIGRFLSFIYYKSVDVFGDPKKET